MEPQVDICFKKEKKRKCCMEIAIFIIVVLLAFVVGLIIGALTGLVEFLGTGAIVLSLATLIVLLIIEIAMLICCRRRTC